MASLNLILPVAGSVAVTSVSNIHLLLVAAIAASVLASLAAAFAALVAAFASLVAAFASLSFRYIIAGGLFAIALDADHLVNFLNIDIIIRMAHSIPFALLSPILMMFIFGRRDYLLGAISFAAVFSHMSLDTFFGGGDFPIFAPFVEYLTAFEGTDWMILQLIAISAVIVAKLFSDKKKPIKN